MTEETLAEVLSGLHEPTCREDLHRMLDDLLDATDADGGQMDGPAFWGFVAALARGHGIADQLRRAAARHMADVGRHTGGRDPLPEDLYKDPAEALATARMAQWALLATLLRHVTAFPGEIVPRELQASWFIAVADNVLVGRGKLGKGKSGGGYHMDLLGLGTQRQTEDKATQRAARRLLVGAVYFRAEQTGKAVDEVRGEMMPQLKRDTWQGWVREVAKTKRIPPSDVAKEPRYAATLSTERGQVYDLDDATVAELFEIAWWTNDSRRPDPSSRSRVAKKLV